MTSLRPGAAPPATRGRAHNDVTQTIASDPTTGSRAPEPAGTTTTVPRGRRRRLEIALFVIPAAAFNLIWGWYPLASAVGLSFTSAQVRGPVSFTGLESYLRIWHDPLVSYAFKTTLIFTALSIVLTFVVPILVAIMLMEMGPRTMRWMMLLWFLPLSPIAGALLWKYFYNSQYGLFQWIATSLGLGQQPFLNSGSQVLVWLVLPGLILFGPGLIYMATLQGIPTSYYEAAEIEGAGFWRKIWTISLPRLRPVISMMLLFAIIGNLQQFEWPTIMTGGGPGGASRTVVMYVYSLLQALRYADATALSILLFILIMAVVIVIRFVYPEDPDAPRRQFFKIGRAAEIRPAPATAGEPLQPATSRQDADDHQTGQPAPAPEPAGTEGVRPPATRSETSLSGSTRAKDI